MSIKLPIVRALALFTLAAGAISPSASAAADREHPTVVELFQSQGCSSCPPANTNAMALSDRPDLLVLSFGVTYWDHLGWKDTFGSPQNTARQWDYAHGLRHGEVWTPQVVVNGRIDTPGFDRSELETVIRKADRGVGGPSISVQGDRLTLSAGDAGTKAQVFLVRYDPNIVQVPIQRGENGGKTLPHRNVVRELVSLGAWTGETRTYVLPGSGASALKSAVIVQNGRGGPIIAAARL